MSDWVDSVREWTANYFSVTETDMPLLLRKVADSLDQLGDVEVLDITFFSNPEEDEATMTVYFRFEDDGGG